MVFFDFLSSAKRHNAFAKKKKRKKRRKKDIMPWSMHEIANVLFNWLNAIKNSNLYRV